MSSPAVQIVARGPRPDAEAAAAAIDSSVDLEGVAYSILEEDEARGVWRIDAFPADNEEATALMEALAAFPELSTASEVLAGRRPRSCMP